MVENQVVGYLLGVLDTSSFEEKLINDYWPSIKAKYTHINIETTPSDKALLLELAEKRLSNKGLIARYPSHLHIDIIESHQRVDYGLISPDGVMFKI